MRAANRAKPNLNGVVADVSDLAVVLIRVSKDRSPTSTLVKLSARQSSTRSAWKLTANSWPPPSAKKPRSRISSTTWPRRQRYARRYHHGAAPGVVPVVGNPVQSQDDAVHLREREIAEPRGRFDPDRPLRKCVLRPGRGAVLRRTDVDMESVGRHGKKPAVRLSLNLAA
jgi:hypothetical protein